MSTDHAAVLYGGAPAAKTTVPASTPPSEPRSLAQALYGTTATQSTHDTAKGNPAPRTDATARPDGAAATALYGEPDATADAEKRQVIEGTHGSAMRTISALSERAGWDAETARQQGEAAGRLFHTHGISSDDAQFVTEVAVAAEVSPPGDDVLNQWRGAAHDTLRQEFGDSAKVALADARALVAQDKQLHDYLDRTGLGNHPKIVRIVANRARQLRLAGKLK